MGKNELIKEYKVNNILDIEKIYNNTAIIEAIIPGVMSFFIWNDLLFDIIIIPKVNNDRLKGILIKAVNKSDCLPNNDCNRGKPMKPTLG